MRIAWLILAIVIAVAAFGPSVRAQDDDDESTPQVKAAPPQQVMIHEDDFDRWLFGRLGDKNAARLRLEAILTTRVEKVARQCSLTEGQKRKLLVAGRGDIKRLFDRVEEMRPKRDGDEDDRTAFQQFLEEMRPLRVDSSGDVFGEGSIFAKVFKMTLTTVQSAQYEKVAREGALSRHRATIRWVVATLDTVLELNAEQHGQLEALLAEHTRPPRYFGEYDYYGVLFQASKLAESRFKSILSDGQWTKLSQHIAESQRLLPTLKAGGFIPDDDVAAAAGSNGQPAANLQNKRG